MAAPHLTNSHFGSFLPLAGGAMTGAITWRHTYPPQIGVVGASAHGDLEITPGAGLDASGRGSLIFNMGAPASGHSYQGGAVVLKSTGTGTVMELSTWGSGSATPVYVRMAAVGVGLRFQTTGASSHIIFEPSASLQLDSTGAVGSCLMNGGTIRVQANSTGLGFFAATPVAKPTVSGAKGGNAALGSLMTALSNLGLVTDSTSA